MSIICALVGHRPSSVTIENAGHAFTRCVRCAADLVEVQGRWQTAPKGFRIVWKEPDEAAGEAGAADAGCELETLELEVETHGIEPEALGLDSDILDLEMEAVLDRAMADDTPEFAQGPAPAPAPERRGGDRRAPPGTQPKFTGVDRRRGDRRGSFGRNRGPAHGRGGPEPAAGAQYDLI